MWKNSLSSNKKCFKIMYIMCKNVLAFHLYLASTVYFWGKKKHIMGNI